jgi:hypothetical protein
MTISRPGFATESFHELRSVNAALKGMSVPTA